MENIKKPKWNNRTENALSKMKIYKRRSIIVLNLQKKEISNLKVKSIPFEKQR